VALWDAVLSSGRTVWGVATDDAHDYEEGGGGRYPAGGAWIMVDAERDADAIVEAIGQGRFYASTGVFLREVGIEGDAFAVAIDDRSTGPHRIRFVGDGRTLAEASGRSARLTLVGATRYVRVEVEGPDGGRAWSQPVPGRIIP
jgi:hypothetical protein